MTLEELAAQVRAQSPQADWNVRGVDRAMEVASLLRANGINDLGQLRLTGDQSNYQLVTQDGRSLGFLGDVNRDGSTSRVGEFSTIRPENLVGWSSQGKGQVSYRIQPGQGGQFSIAPDWKSSSDGGWLGDVLGFEAFNLKDMAQRIGDNPARLLYGAGDEFGTKLWNEILGRNDEPIVNRWGGATDGAYQRAEDAGIDTKAGRQAHGAAEAIAAIYAGRWLGGLGNSPTAPAGGGPVGSGGSMAGAGYVPGGLGIDTTLGTQIGANLANAGYFGPAATGGAGVAGGAAAAGGAGGGGGAGGLVAGNADKAALLGNAGYGQGMSGAATSAFDTVAGVTGSNQLGAAAGNAMDGNWLQAAQNVGGNMNWLDWGKLGLQALGAYKGYQDGKDQTQTQTRDPWGPAQPFILDALQQGRQLNQQYQRQPFSPQQQTAYNNLGGLLNLANTNAPGLLSGFQANATGANNYDRSNPRKSLLGSAPMQGAWNPGLLSFFPQNGGGG